MSVLSKLTAFKDIIKKNEKNRFDMIFVVSVILVTLYGTLMVFSAGTAYAEARYNDTFYFIKKQTIWLIIGFAVMYAASHIDPGIYKKYTPYFYGATLFLLVLVLIVGFVGNGAQRWISIGPLTIQPSEIAKLTMIMMLAEYFSRYEKESTDRKSKRNIFIYGTLFPCIIMAVPILLVMLQKHLSCIIILGTIGLLLIIVSADAHFVNKRLFSCTAVNSPVNFRFTLDRKR